MYHGVTSNSGPSNAVPVKWASRVVLCGYSWNLISHYSGASQEIEVRGFCKVMSVCGSCILVKTCQRLYRKLEKMQELVTTSNERYKRNKNALQLQMNVRKEKIRYNF